MFTLAEKPRSICAAENDEIGLSTANYYWKPKQFFSSREDFTEFLLLDFSGSTTFGFLYEKNL